MKNFKISEFDSPDEIGSGAKMDKDFLSMIDKARDFAGTPFKINSGYRTLAHNRKVGGKLSSSHLKGMAADIHCANDTERHKILMGCIKAGFTRIGIAKTFIHVDNDKTKNQNRIWVY
jgi:uncharacterized protein YcbK (DUF882 family)